MTLIMQVCLLLITGKILLNSMVQYNINMRIYLTKFRLSFEWRAYIENLGFQEDPTMTIDRTLVALHYSERL